MKQLNSLTKLKAYVDQCKDDNHYALIDVDLFNLYLAEMLKELNFPKELNTSGIDSLLSDK